MNPELPKATGVTHAVVHDIWDRADLKRALREVRPLARVRRKLSDQHWTGSEAVDDAFFLLHKADPHLVDRAAMRASHVVNHQVIHELLATAATRRLREYTVGDFVAAATAAVEIAQNLEAIFDRLSLARESADRLQRVLEALAKAQRAGDEELSWLLEESAAHEHAMLSAIMASQAPDTAIALADAAGAVALTMGAQDQMCRAWGMAPGELTRLPVDERLRLARKLNTPRMAEIANLFGRISNLAMSTTVEEVEDVHDDVVDLETGSDLSRVLPSEFLALADPLTTPGFLARLASDELLQATVRGPEEMGRGAIVMCIDGSGSMSVGERDLWAKATMLVLLHQARLQGRQMHVINFGYGQMVHHRFMRPADFTPERIIEAAEAFWASGTDFETPMMQALEVLRTEVMESGRTRADVVFATDDECWVNPPVMEAYLAGMREVHARTWGLMVGEAAAPDGPLSQMSEGRVLTVKDLTSGQDVRSLLGGIR
jgi:uncharacterized protein with von Willebrand factor type A (vWA) domain